MRKILLLSICILFSLLSYAQAQPIPTSPWYYSSGTTAHSKPGVESVVIGGTSQGSLQLYDTTGLNKVTVLTESVLGADFIVTLPISGGCDPSALSDGTILFVVSGVCAGNASNFSWDNSNIGQRVGPADTSGQDFIYTSGLQSTGDGNTTFARLSMAAANRDIPILRFSTFAGDFNAPAPSSSGDSPLNFVFNAANASSQRSALAELDVEVDGAPGATFIPGRFRFYTATNAATLTERLRIDSAGRSTFGAGGYGVGFATVDPITGFTIMGDTPTPLSSGTSARESTASLIIHADGDSGDFDRPDFVQTATTDFARHVFNAAGGTFGAMTNITTGATIGRVDFQGYAGTFNVAAQIIANAEGTIASSQVPGRIELWTAIADGTLNNGLRFDSSGRLNIRRVFATADATAPGTFYSSLQWVCGTNAGTVKLTTRAGTSTTAVTLVDNVGGGVNGC